MKIEKIILKEGEKKPEICGKCNIRNHDHCPAINEWTNYYWMADNCPIVEQPAITDPETLDNTLSQHEEVEGYEFVNGVGGSVDCNNCEIPHTTSCPESCASLNGYYKRKE